MRSYVLFIDPPSVLPVSLSVTIALIPIFGGVGTVAGPIVGAAVLIRISEYSRVWFSGNGRNVDLLIYGGDYGHCGSAPERPDESAAAADAAAKPEACRLHRREPIAREMDHEAEF